MPDTTLVAETRTKLGTSEAKRLRAQGKIPVVVYGHGTDPHPAAVDGRALRAALTTGMGLNALLTLQLDGREQLAMAKDIQRDITRGTVSHVDFLIVSRDEIVTADVPLLVVGEATAVTNEDGVVSHELATLTVHATPGAIPNHIEVDISALQVGETIRVGDIPLPPGVTTDVDPDHAVAVGQPPQVTAADLVTEGAEGEAAEGEAAAAGAGEGAAETESTTGGE